MGVPGLAVLLYTEEGASTEKGVGETYGTKYGWHGANGHHESGMLVPPILL